MSVYSSVYVVERRCVCGGVVWRGGPWGVVGEVEGRVRATCVIALPSKLPNTIRNYVLEAKMRLS